MASDTQTKSGPCKVCGGSKAEHFDDQNLPLTVHAYTERDGDLISHEQVEAAKRRQNQPMVMLPPKINGTDESAIKRLIELLIEKGILSSDEVMYIFGVATKPEPPKFNDPAALFGTDSPGGGV